MYNKQVCPYCGTEEDYLTVEDVKFKDGKMIFKLYCEVCEKPALIIFREIGEDVQTGLKKYKII